MLSWCVHMVSAAKQPEACNPDPVDPMTACGELAEPRRRGRSGTRGRGCCVGAQSSSAGRARFSPMVPNLSAPPAVSKAASSRCQRHHGSRGWCAGGYRRRYRRARAGRRARARHDRPCARHAQMAAPRWAQPRWRALGGRGASSPQRAGGGGLAPSPFTALSRWWGHRQRRDRSHRPGVRDRDKNAHVRCAPPGQHS